jgi:hypothetical protein
MMPARRFVLCCATILIALGCGVPAADAQSANPRAAPAKKAVAAKPLKIAPGRRVSARGVTAPKRVVTPRSARAPLVRQRATPARALARASARDPVPAAPVVEPVPLTAIQREAIYRSIVQTPLQPNPVITERVLPPAASAPQPAPPPAAPGAGPVTNPELTVGAPVPPSVALHPIPDEAVEAVPEIARYRYAFIGERVFLVDPASGIVVSAVNQ